MKKKKMKKRRIKHNDWPAHCRPVKEGGRVGPKATSSQAKKVDKQLTSCYGILKERIL